MMRIKNKNRAIRTKGFSLIELLIVVAIILIIAAIGIPSLLRARISANESAAVATMRNIGNSEATYITAYSSFGFANTLAKLGPAPAGTPCSEAASCMVDELVGCAAEPCAKSGYEYFLTSSSGSSPFPDFTATATPTGFGGTGGHNYCLADDGVVRSEKGAKNTLAAAVSHTKCMDPLGYVAIQ